MNLKLFFVGLFLSFGVAWVSLIVLPVARVSHSEPVSVDNEKGVKTEYYQHKVSGRVLNGSIIYQNNGCNTCHTQVVRPAYAGSDILRQDAVSEETPPLRETNKDDFEEVTYANVGLQRIGPDLSNVGYRAEVYAKRAHISPYQWMLKHLFNPRASDLRFNDRGQPVDMSDSVCPAQRQMFDLVNSHAQQGGFVLHGKHDKRYKPNEFADALASYLLSLKRSEPLPASLSHQASGKK